MSPKSGGIRYSDSEYLINPVQDLNYPTNTSKKIPELNSRVYGELIYLGFKKFEKIIIDGTEPNVLQNIYNNIILPNDSLEDKYSLEEEIKSLGKNPYDPCKCKSRKQK